MTTGIITRPVCGNSVVVLMKEIHAYRNEDGTYRVECIGCTMDNGVSKEVAVRIPRAKLDFAALATEGWDEIYSIEVKEN